MPPQDVFPFVVGCPRSGTTLLRAMLDARPDLAVPGEAHFLIPMARRHASAPDAPFDPRRFLADLAGQDRFSFWDLEVTQIAAAFDRNPPPDVPEAFRLLYATYASAHGATRYADKTPHHLAAIRELGALFPEARFVHLVRDGRDVALSWMEAPFGPHTLAGAASEWRERLERGRAAGRELGPDRYREFRYEDLVAEPDATLRSIEAYLGLPAVPVRADHRRSAPRVITETRHPGQHHRVTEPVRTGVRDWRSQMRGSDVEVFEFLAGGTLRSFGYPTVTSPGLVTRLRVAVALSHRAGRAALSTVHRRLRALGPS